MQTEGAGAREGVGGWVDRALDQRLFEVSGEAITVANLLLIAAVLAASFLLSRLAQRALEEAFRRRRVGDEGTVHVAKRLLHYGIMTVGTVVALVAGNVNLTALFAAGAIFAVVAGFAMQNISENFVAGVILMIERSITPGDILEVETRVVRVVKMGIRATVARTRDEEELIIPNSLMVRSTVKNYTLRDSIFRLRAQVGVSYGSDLRLVRKVLEEAAARIPWRDPEREPRILLLEFGSSAVQFEASVWMEDPWHAQRARSQLNEAIWWAFQEAGIRIAFPQLDVHFDRAVEELVRPAEPVP